MNIFYLHRDPKKAAVIQYNKHVVKMILESAQMLCTAHHHYAIHVGYSADYVPYKKAHYNHPSTIWCRQNESNYKWLYDHMISLGDEYTARYGKVHKTITKCKDVLKNYPVGMPQDAFTEPPQCMPDEYKVEGDSVSAYWNYYEQEKQSIRNKDEKKIVRPLNYN